MKTPPTAARRRPLTTIGLLLACALAGCGGDAQQAVDSQDEPAEAPSNRIDVPPIVRRNLGIEFVAVERRHVRRTLRLPARVELLPSATAEYRAPFAGRVRLEVEPLQRVEAGDLLYRLDSHEWRRHQQELGELTGAVAVTAAQRDAMAPLLEACERHEASLRDAYSVTEGYVEDLRRAERDVGGQAQKIASARVELARLAADLADASEKHTELQTRGRELEARLGAQQDQLTMLLAGAAAALGVDASALRRGDAWRQLAVVEVRATRPGVVDVVHAPTGSLVEGHGAVLTTVDPRRVRCRADALQSDAAALQDGLSAAVVPFGAAYAATVRAPGSVRLGPTGDSRTRTLELFVLPDGEPAAWLRPGLAVFVEVTTAGADGDPTPPLAIPSAAVLPDGLDRVFFRRDPKAPDRVIRVTADLGHDDGRWVEVKSGIMDGDEVVLAGAFELVLASSGQQMKGGHFHADGTWHEDH